jgi:hypothetical protein
MSASKRSTGSGFQIPFKGRRAMVVVEANDRHNSPGSILGGMGGTALVVSSQSLLEVNRQSDIALFRVRDALQEIDVFHRFYPRCLFNEAEENCANKMYI